MEDSFGWSQGQVVRGKTSDVGFRPSPFLGEIFEFNPVGVGERIMLYDPPVSPGAIQIQALRAWASIFHCGRSVSWGVI